MIRKLILTLVVCCTPLTLLPGQAQPYEPYQSETYQTDPVKKLRVGVAGSPPFTMWNVNRPEGISTEIWQTIASQEQWDYEWVPAYNMNNVFDRTLAGDLDIVIGPISITSKRLRKVTFTQPFYQAKIGVLLPGAKPTLWSRVRPLFGVAAISSIGLIVAGLFVVGNLLWVVEKDAKGTHFPSDYWHGVGNGMWFALVTLTTVGYGDHTPTTPIGRLIAGIWMIVTMVMVSSLIAGLTTALTLSLSGETVERFVQPSDLEDAEVAVVSGTTGEEWAKVYKAQLNPTAELSQAVALLKAGKVDGVVFDVPALQHYLKEHPEAPLRVAAFSLAEESYGFVLPQGSPIKNELDIALLEMQESGKLEEIVEDWLELQ